jgi:uncharacterized protein (TIGR00369 family)
MTMISRSRNVTWTDPMVALQQAASMSRDELLAALTSGDLPRPPIAHLLDFDVREATPGRSVLVLRPGEYLYNVLGVVAGGVAATVLDAAMWIAMQTSLPEQTIARTVSMNVNLVAPLTTAAGEVLAEGKAVHVGRTTGTAEGWLTDADGKLYAHATAGFVTSFE